MLEAKEVAVRNEASGASVGGRLCEEVGRGRIQERKERANGILESEDEGEVGGARG